MTLTLSPIKLEKIIEPGDRLAKIIVSELPKNGLTLVKGDIFVITQKIISKSEGRLINLTEITPSQKAIALAEQSKKDARFVELVLRESKEVIRVREGTIITEHRLGFVCANAGIDHSNVRGSWGNAEDWFLLLPENPDLSALRIAKDIEYLSGINPGILIIDSHGRAWRNGTIGTTIGTYQVPGIVDMRGKEDLFGYKLRITMIAVADELAGAASLLMGQADEGIPVIHVRGFPYPLRDSAISELIREKKDDLFR